MGLVLGLAALVAGVVGTRGVLATTPQQQPPTARTGFIMGRVVEGTSDRPVAKALVRLDAAGGSSRGRGSGNPNARAVITDANGQFLFRELPAGSYALAVQTSNTSSDNAFGLRRAGGTPQALDLKDGERMGNITLRVWKLGAISGTITDASGDPMVETRVSVLRADIVAGRRRFRVAGTSVTDDRGVYRISQLVPGEYVVYLPFTQNTLPLSLQREAGSNSNDLNQELWTSGAPETYGTGFRVGDAILVREPTAYGANGPMGPIFKTPLPGADGRLLVYPIQYFPSATRPADATVITIDSGQERNGADMQTRLVPGVKISGRIVGPDGPLAHVGVRLVAQNLLDVADESSVQAAGTITESSGTFTLLGVPPGEYLLRVARQPLVKRPPPQEVTIMGPGGGTTSFVQPPAPAIPPFPEGQTWFVNFPVSVGGADVADMNVMLQGAGRVTGRVDFDGTRERPSIDQLRRLSLQFTTADGGFFAGSSATGVIDAAGSLRSVPLLPGRYTLSVSGVMPDGWYLKSATISGRDAFDQPLTIDNRDLSDLVLWFTDHPASLSGRVRDRSGNADKDASVIVFPADRTRWTDTGPSPRTLRLLRVSPSGSFSTGSGLSLLPPGEYFAVAIDDHDAAGWNDPARLDAFSRVATRFTLNDGEKKSLDLVTAVVR